MKNLLSIVIPAYCEDRNIALIHKELTNVLKKIKTQYEIIFVDDGSKDDTWDEILKLYNQDKHIKGLRFTKNFGHQYALLAGMNYAKGQAVITLDADLQHPPEIITQLLQKWKEGFKIVNTQRIDNTKLSY